MKQGPILGSLFSTVLAHFGQKVAFPVCPCQNSTRLSRNCRFFCRKKFKDHNIGPSLHIVKVGCANYQKVKADFKGKIFSLYVRFTEANPTILSYNASGVKSSERQRCKKNTTP
jgi:hypothetical protein